MKNYSKYLIILLLLISNQAVFSQETESLNSYLELAAQSNPELKAAFFQYQSALEKVPQVGSLPDPQASFGFFTKPMAIMAGEQVGNIQIMQMFPWFGTLKAGKDEASAMAKAKFEVFNATKADLFFQVKSKWYQLMKLDREISLVKENIELLESMEKLALIKFQSPGSANNPGTKSESASMAGSSGGNMNTTENAMNGMNANAGTVAPTNSGTMQSGTMAGGMDNKSTGLQDVLRVKMEILEQKNKLASLQDQRQTAETEFNALLNRDLVSPVKTPDSLEILPLPSDKLAIADSILQNNPMLAMLENEIDSYELMEQKARKMGNPMLGVGLNYMLNQERDGNTFMMNGKDMVMPMFSVSIPIFRKKYTAMQNEAKYLQEAGKQQSISLQNSLQVQYRNFIQNLNDAERRVQLYREQEELARKTTDLLLAGFTTNGADYEEVLRMQYKVLDYGFKYIEAVTDYNVAVATAEKLMNSVKN